MSIGPIRFDRDGMKTLLLDEALGDCSAVLVKFLCSMGCVTEEDEMRLSDILEQRIVIQPGASQRLQSPFEAVCRFLLCICRHTYLP
jgi:hypothetical protein